MIIYESMHVAYFDLDKTLLSVNTGDMWFKKLRLEKRISWHQIARGIYWALQYRLGRANMEAQIAKAVKSIAGFSRDELQREFSELFQEKIRHLYRPGALKALAMHRVNLDRVVLLTSAPSLIADSIMLDLKFDDCLCTRLETIDGKYTGNIEGQLCYGKGKFLIAEAYSRERGFSLKDSTFYTDSFTDVPMLQAVGNPVVINPDGRLSRFAKKHHWPIKDWGIPTHVK